MKLLWLAHRDPKHPRAGGAERTIEEVSSRLSGMGYEITILAAMWKGSKEFDTIGNVKIRRFGNNIFLHLFVPVFLVKNRFDIVINDLGHAVPWPSTSILRAKSIVFFRHLHARSLPGQVNRLLALVITSIERCYFLIYPHSIFVTESTTSRSDLLRLGISETNIILNPPGVDLNRYNMSEKTGVPSIVYFGGFRRYKRPLEAVSIFEVISKLLPEARFTFIGDGPELQNVKSGVGMYGIEEKTTFTGRIDDVNLAKIVSQSWLNVHTSITEGWGLSIIEASACGTPTVAYSVPGMVDTIEDGLNGIKVKDCDRGSFVNEALSILKNPNPWQETSRKVAEKYSWDRTAAVWDKLIREVA